MILRNFPRILRKIKKIKPLTGIASSVLLEVGVAAAADGPAVELDVGDVWDVVTVAKRSEDPDGERRPGRQSRLESEDRELDVVRRGHVAKKVLRITNRRRFLYTPPSRQTKAARDNRLSKKQNGKEMASEGKETHGRFEMERRAQTEGFRSDTGVGEMAVAHIQVAIQVMSSPVNCVKSVSESLPTGFNLCAVYAMECHHERSVPTPPDKSPAIKDYQVPNETRSDSSKGEGNLTVTSNIFNQSTSIFSFNVNWKCYLCQLQELLWRAFANIHKFPTTPCQTPKLASKHPIPPATRPAMSKVKYARSIEPRGPQGKVSLKGSSWIDFQTKRVCESPELMSTRPLVVLQSLAHQHNVTRHVTQERGYYKWDIARCRPLLGLSVLVSFSFVMLLTSSLVVLADAQTAALRYSEGGSLSDSGISDTGSDQEASERERRLAGLRRLARQLEAVLRPGSSALDGMREVSPG
ncbi:hypothetical protein FOCC_FOCC005112 [Frankliniella occidentalis]|nr:hypothetical protein FOCC_FOCC005112 [Frankliniella occidentalis]